MSRPSVATVALGGSIAAMDEAAVAPAAVGLRVVWTISPASPRPGAPVTVGYRVVELVSGRPLTALPLDHERPMHLIAVSRDLARFQHIHPQLGPDGTWRVRTTLGPPAPYVLYDEFVHHSRTVLNRREVVVGRPSPAAVLQPDLAPRTVGGMTVALQVPAIIPAGQQAHFTYWLTRAGQPVTDLQPYLGAAAHIAVVSADTRTFAHTHGAVDRMAAMGGAEMPAPPVHFGPMITVTHTFPHAGLYKIWAQIGYHGHVLVAPFVVAVR